MYKDSQQGLDPKVEKCLRANKILARSFGSNFYSNVASKFNSEPTKLCALLLDSKSHFQEFLYFFGINEKVYFDKNLEFTLNSSNTFKELHSILPKRYSLPTLTLQRISTENLTIDEKAINANLEKFKKFRAQIINYALQYIQSPIEKYKFVIYHLLEIRNWNELVIKSRDKDFDNPLAYALKLLVQKLKEVNLIVNFVSVCCTQTIAQHKLNFANANEHLQSTTIPMPNYYLINVCNESNDLLKIYVIVHELIHIISDFEKVTLHKKPNPHPEYVNRMMIVECHHPMNSRIATILENIMLENIVIRPITRYNRIANSIATTATNFNIDYRIILRRFINLHSHFNWEKLDKLTRQIEFLIAKKQKMMQEKRSQVS